jgi:O-antigen/teichoic acid export membrane protein
MGLIIRQSVKAAVVSYLGVVIGMVNVLFISLRFLSTEEVGLTRVIFETSLLFASLAHLGTPFITDKFFPYFKNEEEKHQGFLAFLLTYSLVGYGLFTLLFLLLRERIAAYYLENSPRLIGYFYFVLASTFFIMYQAITESYCRIHGRIVVPTIVRELFLKSANIAVIIGYGVGWYSFDTFILLSTGSYALAVVFNFLYIRWLGRLYLRPDFTRINRKRLLEISAYGLFIILGGVGTVLSQKIDAIMLPAMRGLDYTAIYGVAFLIAQVIEIPKRAISQISSPILSQAWKSNDLRQIESLYRKSAVNQLLAGMLLFLLMWSSIDALFSILPKSDVYKQGKYVVLLISLSRLVDMGTGLNGEIILYSRHYRFATLAVVVLAVTTIVTNLLLIPLYALNGAALATAASVLVFVLIKVVFVRIRFGIHPFAPGVLLVLLMGAVVYFIASIVPVPPPTSFLNAVLSIAIRSLVVAGLFLPLVYLGNVSPDLNGVAGALLTKARNLLPKKPVR